MAAYSRQEGACEYTATRLHLRRMGNETPLAVTMERRNPDHGYSIANFCLVVGGVNCRDQFPVEHVASIFGPLGPIPDSQAGPSSG